MYERNYTSNLAFVDLLFNLIVGIAFLFIISFLLINDPTKEENVRPMAEYMVILTWEGEKNSDIDLWMEGPSIFLQAILLEYLTLHFQIM